MHRGSWRTLCTLRNPCAGIVATHVDGAQERSKRKPQHRRGFALHSLLRPNYLSLIWGW